MIKKLKQERNLKENKFLRPSTVNKKDYFKASRKFEGKPSRGASVT